MEKNVKIIEPVVCKAEKTDASAKRVCAYTRVSTATDKQEKSFASQVEYYTSLIQKEPEWEFVGIYADEAISGTNKMKRNEFLNMIEACKAGKVDMIITKSITRFARNTIESIQTIRELKSIGVAVYFENEHINTMAVEGELMLTILSSIAQSESEDISSNIRWSINRRFQTGTFIISDPPYGYKKNENQELEVDDKTAPIVKRIYQEYLNGIGIQTIAKGLEKDNIPPPRGNKNWNNSVRYILKNEKYTGDNLLQKKYSTNVFPYKRKINYGEKLQYYIEEDHPPIISREESAAVLAIFEYRRLRYKIETEDKEKYIKKYQFSGRIICCECGSHFKRQIIYGGRGDTYIRWCCKKHIKNKQECSMVGIREDIIQEAFVKMWNKLITNRGKVLEPYLSVLKNLRMEQEQIRKIEKYDEQIKDLVEQSHIMMRLAAQGYMDSVLFMEKRNEIEMKIAEAKHQRNLIRNNSQWKKEILKTEEIIGLINESKNLLQKFNEELFDLTVETIVIEKEQHITFCLHNGMKLTERRKQ